MEAVAYMVKNDNKPLVRITITEQGDSIVLDILEIVSSKCSRIVDETEDSFEYTVRLYQDSGGYLMLETQSFEGARKTIAL